MVRRWSVIIALMLSWHLSAQELIVDLPLQQKALQYPDKTRLSQVLIDTHTLVPNQYPLGFFLADPNKQVEAKKRFLNIEAELVERKNKPNYASLNQAAAVILEQLSKFEFKHRILLNLDYDWVRSQPSKDPMLTYEGRSRFELYAYTRPQHIRLIGAVDRPGTLPFEPHSQLSDYLYQQKISLLDGANKTQAYAIQPDGKIEEIGFGWWNSNEVYLAPGAVIFIGLSSLWNENEELNHEIAKLLVHRVGL